MLGRGEKVLGDLGYRGDTRIITKLQARNRAHSYAMGCARDRHEQVNGRLKTWAILRTHFRHNRHKHHYAFRAVIVIEQLKMENGDRLFQVNNYIDPIRF